MTKQYLLFLVLATLSLASCGPRLSKSMHNVYAPLDAKEELVVFDIDERVPDGAEELGSLSIGDTGFSTKCGYEEVLNLAKAEARKVGGNAIKLMQHLVPDLSSSCHRIVAVVLRLDNPEEYLMAGRKLYEVDSALFAADCAVLNVYRDPRWGRTLVRYNLHLGDSLLCRIIPGTCETILVNKLGRNTLWAKTEAKRMVPINIEAGRTYYVRCAVGTGIFVGRPHIELVSKEIGETEFKAILQRKKPKNKE